MLRDEEHRGGIILLHDGQPLPGGPGGNSNIFGIFIPKIGVS